VCSLRTGGGDTFYGDQVMAMVTAMVVMIMH
jgi:hypothetical protein